MTVCWALSLTVVRSGMLVLMTENRGVHAQAVLRLLRWSRWRLRTLALGPLLLLLLASSCCGCHVCDVCGSGETASAGEVREEMEDESSGSWRGQSAVQ